MQEKPDSLNSCETFSRCDGLREAIATRAPFLAKVSLIALPMPVPPPVTKATLPASIICSRSNGIDLFLPGFF